MVPSNRREFLADVGRGMLVASLGPAIATDLGLSSAYARDTPDALSFGGTYKVVFLAFPLEAYGTAAQKADLISRSMTFFGP